MEITMTSVAVIFFILMAIFGLQNTLKFLPALIIMGLLIYLLGSFVIHYFWPLLIIWFLFSLFKNRNRTNRTYTNTSNGRSRTRYYGNMNQEQAEEFFRDFFRGAGGFEQNTYNGNSYGGYNNGYSGQNNGYQGNYNYGGVYQEDKTKYYKILGVSSNATPDELKKAYLTLVKEHHPDRFTNSSESEKKYHEDKMKQINEAYDKLTKN